MESSVGKIFWTLRILYRNTWDVRS